MSLGPALVDLIRLAHDRGVEADHYRETNSVLLTMLHEAYGERDREHDLRMQAIDELRKLRASIKGPS
jgi:hypothetical protein